MNADVFSMEGGKIHLRYYLLYKFGAKCMRCIEVEFGRNLYSKAEFNRVSFWHWYYFFRLWVILFMLLCLEACFFKHPDMQMMSASSFTRSWNLAKWTLNFKKKAKALTNEEKWRALKALINLHICATLSVSKMVLNLTSLDALTTSDMALMFCPKSWKSTISTPRTSWGCSVPIFFQCCFVGVAGRSDNQWSPKFTSFRLHLFAWYCAIELLLPEAVISKVQHQCKAISGQGRVDWKAEVVVDRSYMNNELPCGLCRTM